MVSCTREGAVLLSQYGWESRWSTRAESWPLVEDHEALLEDSMEEFRTDVDFGMDSAGKFELGSPVSNLDFIAEEQFQLGQPRKKTRRKTNSEEEGNGYDDEDDNDDESGIHMLDIKSHFHTYSHETQITGTRMKSKTLPLPSRSHVIPHRAHTLRSVALPDMVKDRTRSVEHISHEREFSISFEQRSKSVNLNVKHKFQEDSVINNNLYSVVDKNSVEKSLAASEKLAVSLPGQQEQDKDSEEMKTRSVHSVTNTSICEGSSERAGTVLSEVKEEITGTEEQSLDLSKSTERNQIEISITDTDLEVTIADNQNQSDADQDQETSDRHSDNVSKVTEHETLDNTEQNHDNNEIVEEGEKVGESDESSRREPLKKSVSVKEERSSSSESSRTSKSHTDSFNTDVTSSGVDSFDSGGMEFRSLSPIASTNSVNIGEVQMRHKEKKDSKEQVHHSTALRRLSNLTRVPSIRRQSSPGVGLMPTSKFFDFSENAIMYTTAKDAVGYATLRSLMKTRQISMDMESDYGLNNLYENMGSTTSINRRPSIDSTEMRRPKR